MNREGWSDDLDFESAGAMTDLAWSTARNSVEIAMLALLTVTLILVRTTAHILGVTATVMGSDTVCAQAVGQHGYEFCRSVMFGVPHSYLPTV